MTLSNPSPHTSISTYTPVSPPNPSTRSDSSNHGHHLQHNRRRRLPYLLPTTSIAQGRLSRPHEAICGGGEDGGKRGAVVNGAQVFSWSNISIEGNKVYHVVGRICYATIIAKIAFTIARQLTSSQSQPHTPYSPNRNMNSERLSLTLHCQTSQNYQPKKHIPKTPVIQIYYQYLNPYSTTKHNGQPNLPHLQSRTELSPGLVHFRLLRVGCAAFVADMTGKYAISN